MKEILARYQKVCEGKTWYGKNVSESLELVADQMRLRRIGSSYNIVELVFHMLAWRKYVNRLVESGIHQDVPDQENFPEVNEFSDEQWQDLMQTFSEEQKQLLQTLEKCDLNVLDESPKVGYSWRDIFEGLIHHDVYHIGQINFLRKYVDEQI